MHYPDRKNCNGVPDALSDHDDGKPDGRPKVL